jgi:hypothetical protein
MECQDITPWMIAGDLPAFINEVIAAFPGSDQQYLGKMGLTRSR